MHFSAHFSARFFLILPMMAALSVRAEAPPTEAPKPWGPDALRTHVEWLCQLQPPRSSQNPDSLDRAADYIAQQLRDAGGQVSFQTFSVGGQQYKNVLARFGPQDGKILVIGAHYDVAGELPGADDNASGVAGLVGLAFLLGQTPPPMPVELVAYTLEEPPFFATEEMGSAHHARSLKKQNTPVALMLSLEMIGFFSNESGSQNYPSPLLKARYPDRGNFLALVGRLEDAKQVQKLRENLQTGMQLPVESITAPPQMTGVDWSDHRSYWEVGIPALMLTDTSFYRNPAYHTAADQPHTLNYEAISQIIEGLDHAIRQAGF